MRVAVAFGAPYLGPGFGGSSLAALLFADVAVTPRFSLGGEVSVAGAITGAQQQRVPGGSNTLESRHHDTIVSGVAKLTIARSARARAALAGGLGIARRSTDRAGTFSPNIPPFATTPVASSVSSTVPAASGGIDTTIAIAEHVGIIALARVHYLFDGDRQDDGVVRRGVSSLIVRLGAGARIAW